MTAALTPALALDFVMALSADIRAAALLGAGGEHLAGDAELAAAARVHLPVRDGASDAAPDGASDVAPDGMSHAEGRTDTGAVFAASDGTHTIVVATGPFALAGLTRHDLHTALSALGGQIPPSGAPRRLPEDATNALLGAARHGFRRPRAN